MNGINDPTIEATTFTPPPFPTWPPPSGGYPNTTPELGPILNPYPYGTTQGASISTAPPSPPAGWPPPWGPLPGNVSPHQMTAGANGQNQGPGYQFGPLVPPWEVGPIAAPPSISAGNPPYIMGPSSTGTS